MNRSILYVRNSFRHAGDHLEPSRSRNAPWSLSQDTYVPESSSLGEPDSISGNVLIMSWSLDKRT